MIELKNLSKSFVTADGTVEALKDISLSINDGEIFGIIGMSGAGKSTLVRCINMLEKPTQGSVYIDEKNIGTLSSKQLRAERRNISMIFQGFNLLMQRNCLKNVLFPLELEGLKGEKAKQKARELLQVVGLADKEKVYPAQLSGGQKQRIAIARAIATNPRVLLCDEATSALDPQTTHSILSLIKEINQKLGITVVVITHQMSVVEEICDKVAILDNGEVVECGKVSDIFSSPKSKAAKQLVFPEGEQNILPRKENEHHIRVVFNGAVAAKTPFIANLAKNKGIAASILSASTKSIGKKAYGNILLEINADKTKIKEVTDYLNEFEDIFVEEVE